MFLTKNDKKLANYLLIGIMQVLIDPKKDIWKIKPDTFDTKFERSLFDVRSSVVVSPHNGSNFLLMEHLYLYIFIRCFFNFHTIYLNNFCNFSWKSFKKASLENKNSLSVRFSPRCGVYCSSRLIFTMQIVFDSWNVPSPNSVSSRYSTDVVYMLGPIKVNSEIKFHCIVFH